MIVDKTFSVPGRQFASDNYAGICPQAWDALQAANRDHAPAYGDDPWTLRASQLLRELFETDCEVFFVFNGTAANSLALSCSCQSYHSVLCHQTAHVETDECGAPEFFSNGTKVLLLPGAAGKIEPAAIEQAVSRRSDIHYPKPKVLSLTQSTELGTIYTVAEIEALCCVARANGLHVHMDGARFSNAVASLECAPSELTWRAGVEVLCFGMTKNGSATGEAVVFFNRDLANEFDYRCKQAGQLASKMRFLTAPWVGMLEHGAWLDHAKHANTVASYLANKLSKLNVEPIFAPEANVVFVQLDEEIVRELHARHWMFYNFIGTGGCRLMCSWDTTDSDVNAFVADLEELLA